MTISGSGQFNYTKSYPRAKSIALSAHDGEEFKKDYLNDYDKFVSTDCGCDDLDCYCACECHGDEECDCDTPLTYCTCDESDYECDCEYRYDEFKMTIFPTCYYRDYLGDGETQIIKKIGDEKEIKISASEYEYDKKEKAIDALVDKINEETKKVYDDRVDHEFADWFDHHTFPALYVPYSTEDEPYSLPFIEENGQKQNEKGNIQFT
jgi:hypothetical protein